MKILIVNASDINEGVARAVYRLQKALLSHNIDSQMLVQSKSSDNSQNGVLIEIDNVKDSAKKISKLFLEYDYQILANNALLKYKEKYQSKKIIPKLLNTIVGDNI